MPAIANISEARLNGCIVSANFWAPKLNVYSADMQDLADRYAIIASLISAVTGLAAWGTIAASTKWWGQVLVGVMAFAAAVVAVIPKVRGYSDCALKAASLATEYGQVLGDLEDSLNELQSHDQNAQSHSQAAVGEFEKIREKKNNLRPFPKKLAKELDEKRKELEKQPGPIPVHVP